MGISGVPFLGIGPDTAWPIVYLAGVVTIGIGEAIVVYGLGWPLATTLRKLGLDRLLDTQNRADTH
jgi:hypothetical protein